MKLTQKNLLQLIIIAILSLTLLPLAGCEKSDKLELSGTIESLQLDCNSEVAGKVIKLEKEEGSNVKAGDVIAVIDSGVQELVVKQQEEVVKLKQAKLDELKAGTRPEQVEQSEAAVKSTELAVRNARTGVETAQTGYDYWNDKYENVKSLYDKNTASKNDLLDAKYKLDTARQQLDVAKKQLETSQTQLQSAQAQLSLLKKGSTSQTIKAAEADLEQSNLVLEQARLVLSKYQVKTPAEGTLLTRNVETGDMVNTGTNVATISNLKDLWIKVYIQQKQLKSISLSQELDIFISALGKTVKGKITYISDQAEYTPKNVETDNAKENTVFKVKIKILDNDDKLKPGMTADAIVPLGE